MRPLAIAEAALLLLILGCGSERTSNGGQQPEGHAGNAAGAGAAAAEHAGSGGGHASAGAGGGSGVGGSSGFGTTTGPYPPAGAGGAGGIGNVRDPYLSTGGAGQPFEIACQFGGLDYAVGEPIPSIDGCNVCTCGTQGIECSDRECRGQLSADGDARDGDPYIECVDAQADCPPWECECRDGDLGCDRCFNYACVEGICVDQGTRPCSPGDTSLCLENEFCDYSLDAACGTAGLGYCALIFTESRCSQEPNPICGCDGVRYRGPCQARAAGQSSSPATDCE